MSLRSGFVNSRGKLVDKFLGNEAIHPAEYLAFFVEDHGRRDRSNFQKIAQAVFEVDLFRCPVVRFKERLHGSEVFISVDGKKNDVVRFSELALDLLVERMLHTTRTAPRSPEIHDDDLAAEQCEL